MLKGIDPLLGPDLLRALRAMGHGDELAIVDANYPAEAHGRLCVRADGHSATAMLAAILSVLPLDRMVEDAAFRPAPADRPAHPVHDEFATIVETHEPGLTVKTLRGEVFYDRVRAAFLVVATGERRLYGNIVLRKGVIHEDGAGSPGGNERFRRIRPFEKVAS